MNNDRERDRSKSRDRRRDSRNRQQQHPNREIGVVLPEKVEIICALCGEVVKEAASCLALPDSGDPAHFECVMKKISETEPLADGESIAYLGGGNFGIILKNPKSPVGFEIKKKIDFENKEKIGQWRKKLSYKL